MSDLMVEGGPLDGQRLPDYGTSSIRVPVPLPWNVLSLRDPRVGMEVIEYPRRGRVYRWPGLIDDAQTRMGVAAEILRDPAGRRLVRGEAIAALRSLAPDKVVDRIVWVVGYDAARFEYAVVAVVGGRRSERAAMLRERLRLGLPLD